MFQREDWDQLAATTRAEAAMREGTAQMEGDAQIMFPELFNLRR
jgi:hypothetical protein